MGAFLMVWRDECAIGYVIMQYKPNIVEQSCMGLSCGFACAKRQQNMSSTIFHSKHLLLHTHSQRTDWSYWCFICSICTGVMLFMIAKPLIKWTHDIVWV